MTRTVTVHGSEKLDHSRTRLRLMGEGKMLSEVYKTADEAARAMLAYNRIEWRDWGKLNPTAKQAS